MSRIWDALKQAESERSRSKGRKQADHQHHPHSDGADRRRSKRWEQPVPVLIYGSDSEKQPFHEETETADINDDGCSFTIVTAVAKGQRLFLVNMLNDAERECRVVQAGQRSRGKAQIAVEFSGAAPDFWLPRKR
ncbi:MAG: PilZ domain-containing protein [Candidatus Acidiferrales bacterium]